MFDVGHNVTVRKLKETPSIILRRLNNERKLDIQPIIYPYSDYLSGDNDFISKEIKKSGLEILPL